MEIRQGVVHTLGPWTVYDQAEDDGPEYGCSIRSADANADWVAQKVENRADAWLIATAPDLLAFITELAKAAMLCEELDSHLDASEWRRRAERLHAKALGR